MTRTPQDFHKLAEECADAAQQVLTATDIGSPQEAMGLLRASAYAQLGDLYVSLTFSPGALDLGDIG